VRALHLLLIPLLLLGCAKKKGTEPPSNPPLPVHLNEPELIGRNRIFLVWTSSQEEDFSSYRFYRGCGQEDFGLLKTFTQRSETTYTDSELMEGSSYRYKVVVVKQGGQSASSNIVNVYLPGIFLYPPSHITSRSMMISWASSTDPDFHSYQLYHSTSAQVDSTSELLTTYTGSSDTTFCHTELEDNTQHYYRVYIAYQDGSSQVSNLVSGFTQGGDYCFYLQMGDGFGVAGGMVDIPLTLVNCAEVAGYRIVVRWENLPVDSFHIEQGSYFVEGVRFCFDRFSANSESINDSTKVIVFGMAGNSPPIPPSEEPDTLALFTFWLSPNWDSKPITIGFLTESPYLDNTISDPTATLYCVSSACPTNTCPPNPAIKPIDGQITLQP